MTGLFLHALWGDDATPRRPKVLADIARAAAAPWKPEPCLAFAYGRENEAAMGDVGFATKTLYEAPLVDWHATGQRGDNIHAPYGVSIWRHKLHAIRAGLERAEAVCWLDWDCRLMRELPPYWWETMGRGAAFQAALSVYKRDKCHWRDDPQARRIVPSGSFVYCRSKILAEAMLAISAEHPDWYDEQVYAALTDDIGYVAGRPEVYRTRGHQPPGVWVHRPVWQPDSPLFYAPLRWRANTVRQ